jgi:hypothetical protein
MAPNPDMRRRQPEIGGSMTRHFSYAVAGPDAE